MQMIGHIGAVFARLYLLPLYFLSGFFPRRSDLWVFGSWGGDRYADNSAALFEYCHRLPSRPAELIWVSHRPSIVRDLRARGLRACWWWSPEGILACLRAGVHVFDCFPKDTNFWLSRGAVLVNLWSGVPLKVFERDIKISSSRYFRLFHGAWPERMLLAGLMPWHVVHPNLIIASAPILQEITARAFDVSLAQVAVTGLPRNDQLFEPVPVDTLPGSVAAARAAGKKVVLYLPTFRDSGRQFVDLDWQRFEELLDATNARLFIKFHPVDRSVLDPRARNIHVLDSQIDIYSLLPQVDVLVSDFSSVIWDFMLLRRPIVFFLPDLEDFSANSRSLLFDPRTLGAGPVCQSSMQLAALLQQTAASDGELRPPDPAVIKRFNEFADAQSCARVLEAVDRHLANRKSAPRSALGWLRYKLAYNSPLRLTINVLKRLGITALPYYLFYRSLAGPLRNPDLGSREFTELGPRDADRLGVLPMVHATEAEFQRRFSLGQRCFALLEDGQIMAFCWMDPRRCSFPGENFELAAGEAYAFDIYTLPSERGRSLAPLLNARFSDQMRHEGVEVIVGVVDTMNRPSLSFAAKIGCQPRRKSLYLRIFRLVETSIELESYPPGKVFPAEFR